MYRPPTPNFTNAVTAREARQRAPQSELAVQRRQHREHLAAERAAGREERQTARLGAHRITRPAAAIWALVLLRR